MAKTATYTRAYAESNGFLTLLSDGERLTGAYALGPEAGEWLQQATLAIRARVPLDVLRDTIQPFPTFSEIYVAALKALRAEIARARTSRSEADASLIQREPELLGQTVVVIGGSAGIGLETARRARAEGADVILTGRNPERLERAAREVGAVSTAAFDATDFDRARAVLRRAAGADRPRAGHRRRPVLRAAGRDGLRRRRAATSTSTCWLPLHVARLAAGGCGPGARCCSSAAPAAAGRASASRSIGALTAALPALDDEPGARARADPGQPRSPPGFVDTPLSASLLGDQLDARREQLRATLPIGRVVGPADVAALAVHLMTNTALTGATYDIDGGQQLV